MSEKEYWKQRWIGGIQKQNNFATRAYACMRKKKYQTLLDLGCGDGRDAVYFSKKGLQVTALDFSKSGIEKFRSEHPEITSVLKDIKDINFKKNTFDVIYAHLSLHYFDDKTTQKIFNNLYRTLKKGGLIFIKCKSTDDALFGKGEKIAENVYREGHLRHFFTKEYMLKNLHKFRMVKIKKTSSVYHKYRSSFIEAIATK